ncbi:hypothetical protein MFLAVUS_008153 [Mucor flavus]|uniref:Uncharacterized protein n=1 Tax=Mucor flavus TaxID=439312 RepID=A0ABP9Z6D3_9FUNG
MLSNMKKFKKRKRRENLANPHYISVLEISAFENLKLDTSTAAASNISAVLSNSTTTPGSAVPSGITIITGSRSTASSGSAVRSCYNFPSSSTAAPSGTTVPPGYNVPSSSTVTPSSIVRSVSAVTPSSKVPAGANSVQAEDCSKDLIKEKVYEEIYKPCHQIKLVIAKKEMPETDAADNIKD